jgi:hypothetical protein
MRAFLFQSVADLAVAAPLSPSRNLPSRGERMLPAAGALATSS